MNKTSYERVLETEADKEYENNIASEEREVEKWYSDIPSLTKIKRSPTLVNNLLIPTEKCILLVNPRTISFNEKTGYIYIHWKAGYVARYYVGVRYSFNKKIDDNGKSITNRESLSDIANDLIALTEYSKFHVEKSMRRKKVMMQKKPLVKYEDKIKQMDHGFKLRKDFEIGKTLKYIECKCGKRLTTDYKFKKHLEIYGGK